MNLLFITADQWRGECLSSLGHPNVKTPNLDALASDGVLFKRHYAQAAPCSPSRTSLHSGMYLHNHRVCTNGTPFDARHTNWALEVGKAGYAPYLFGYTDTALDPRGIDQRDPRLKHYSEPMRGIATDTVYRNEFPQNWAKHLREHGYPLPDFQYDVYGATAPGTQWEDGGDAPLPSIIKSEHHTTHFMVDLCMNWIGQQSVPWITHLSLFHPHPPFVAPQPYNSMYDPDSLTDCTRLSRLDEDAAQHPWLAHQLTKEKFRAPSNPETIKRLKASYFGLMSAVDDALGRLFKRLKALGKWDDTLIIFTSDHGEQMGDHWLMGKSGYFDASYHIPLIIRDPRPVADGARGTTVDRFSENVDIMPTLLDWLGLAPPTQCDGHSLMPFIHHGAAPDNWRNEVHWEYDFREVLNPKVEQVLGINQHQCALNVIRDENYKYVHFTALPPLFFDLRDDPNEFHNRAQDPKYQKLVLEYAQKLISWRMNHDDRALTETYLSERGPMTRCVEVRG
ncbi:alkaline phosphatase family protein [Candidatus Spongiihabitans sp.]|uniref:alkaline phosphatase family protein n=1 Tax=Candidatus Spongiihabitans sp. TaxID=3101308 RepID=UPI003C7AF0BB